MVREPIRKTTTDIEFFGLSKPEVFEALADWYEYHDEEELNYLDLLPDWILMYGAG